MKKFAIVMTYFNRPAQLASTLNSFKKYNPADFEVVVVDDGSEIPVMMQDYPFKVTIIRITDKNWTQGDPAYNVGFYYALENIKPEKIIIQNAECYHLGDILGFADKNLTDKNYFAFGCYSAGKGELPGEVINDKGATRDGESAWYCHPVHRPKPYHFCAAITADNLRRINGFDERFSFGAGYDDDYLIHQIACLGLEIFITTDPIVVHQWHEHNGYRGFDERALLNINFLLFKELVQRKEFRAEHVITNDLP